MSVILRALIWVFVCLITILPAKAETEVRVIGYDFPPYVENGMNGLTPALLALLNSNQSEFKFTFVPTSPARRYLDLIDGRGHMILFEMPEWGWLEYENQTVVSREIMKGGEVYIAVAVEGRKQSFFDDIGSKSIAAYFGYHYGFAGFNADPDFLTSNYNIVLNHRHERNINLVIYDRVDVGVVTESYLSRYLNDHASLRDQFLISNTHDQIYSLRAIAGPASPITVSQLEGILDTVKADGALVKLFQRFGIENQLTY